MTEVTNTAPVQAETTVVNTEVKAVETNVAQATQVIDLPEKYKGKSLEDVVKMHQEAEKFIGKKVSEMPEELVKQHLKVPTAPEKYLLPDDFQGDLKNVLSDIGVKANISQDQMKAIADALVMKDRADKESLDKKANEIIEANKKELEKEFGTALEKRLEGVKSVLNRYADEQTQEHIKNAGLLHDVNFVKFLDKVSQEVLKHTLVAGDFVQQRALTPQDAKREIDSKLANTEFREAYFSARHPGHKNAVTEMTKLFELAGS